MINRLHRLLHDPQRGWDPIPNEYAEDYAANVASLDLNLVERLERQVGRFEGKHVADVGSGPGQYGLEFARRGAEVTCIDVSRRYLEIARRRFESAGQNAKFVLTYMDSIGRVAPGGFDVIFNNVCWYYCVGDHSFARSMMGATRPGGAILVCVQNAESHKNASRGRRVLYSLHRWMHWKVGHLFPPRGRVEEAFRSIRGCDVSADYTDRDFDIVMVRKSRGRLS